MRHTFGRKAFTPHIDKIISDHINSLGDWFDSEKAIYKDNAGNDIPTVQSTVNDMNSPRTPFSKKILAKYPYLAEI